MKILKRLLKKHLATGFLILIPLAVTISTINWLDKSIIALFSLLPPDYQPGKYLDPRIPGVGIAISIIIIYLTGFLGSVYLGRKIVLLYEMVLARIPGVRWLYVVAKQILEAVYKTLGQVSEEGGERFNGVVLIEYPRKGLYTVAFVTGETRGEIRAKGGEMLNIFVPTTPNPTSGFFLMVHKEDVQFLDMGVDQAFKLIISAGMIAPEESVIEGSGKPGRLLPGDNGANG